MTTPTDEARELALTIFEEFVGDRDVASTDEINNALIYCEAALDRARQQGREEERERMGRKLMDQPCHAGRNDGVGCGVGCVLEEEFDSEEMHALAGDTSRE